MASTERLEQLREQVESLRVQREIAVLESELATHQLMQSRVLEGWGDTVDRTEHLRDWPDGTGTGDPRISLAQDRQNGDYAPFWTTEQEIAEIRGAARFLAATEEVAISALENLVNYQVGVGFSYEVTPQQNTVQAREAARVANGVLEQVLERAGWYGDLERELASNLHRDGEFLIGLEHRGGQQVEIVCQDATWITEPRDKVTLERYLGLPSWDWKYGVATDWGNTSRVHGYFCDPEPGSEHWTYWPVEQAVHAKRNVDRLVKRGCSDFFAVARNVERASKLLGNTLHGSAVQAAIAYVREHAPGVGASDIEDIAHRATDRTINFTSSDGRSKTRKQFRARPGTVVDIPSGMKYHAGPLGSINTEAYVAAIQAALRVVGVRWTMPEYMISADASNGNFASTLVAESPFTKASIARQACLIRKYRELAWKALMLVASRGGAFGVNPRQLGSLIDVVVTGPEIEVRNRLEEHTVNRDLNERGILAASTWAAREGLDLDEQRELGANASPATPIAVSESWAGYP